jgi:glycosyltransferase involved in cell wall biosynthesis
MIRATLSSIDDPGLELVVQDNTSDNSEALRCLKEIDDPRVVYRHESQRLSIVENTELALVRASGEYLTFVGDDDLVSPFLVDFVRVLAAEGIEAVTYSPAFYWWPSVTFAEPSRFHQPGALWLPNHIGGAIRWFDSRAELDRVLRRGAVSIFSLPRLYHGVVRRDVLARLRRSAGRYVCGASPDMALAVGLGLAVWQHVHISYPLTIYGASRNSGGGYTAEGRHFGRLEEQKHLPQSTIDHWNPKLPRVWSEYTIYPQTAGEVLHAMSLPDTIDYTSFYAAMFVNEPHLRDELAPLLRLHLRNSPSEVGRFVSTIVQKTIGRLRRAANSRIFGLPYELHVLPSPSACMQLLHGLPRPQIRVDQARRF